MFLLPAPVPMFQDPGTIFQDPGTMFQDPGTLFQDPGTMFDHYPFSPPAEFTKKIQKYKVPLLNFRKAPNLDQKFDPLPLLATG